MHNKANKLHKSPNYKFLISYDPKSTPVNREYKLASNLKEVNLSSSKKADILAKEASHMRIKKGLIKSLILVSFVLVLELVVYLARNKFGIN